MHDAAKLYSSVVFKTIFLTLTIITCNKNKMCQFVFAWFYCSSVLGVYQTSKNLHTQLYVMLTGTFSVSVDILQAVTSDLSKITRWQSSTHHRTQLHTTPPVPYSLHLSTDKTAKRRYSVYLYCQPTIIAWYVMLEDVSLSFTSSIILVICLKLSKREK